MTMQGRINMRRKSLNYLIGALFVTWVAIAPAFGAALPLSNQEIGGIQAGKAVPLTDTELDGVTAGESTLCMPNDEAGECTSKSRGRFTDIIFWDEWVNKGSRQASGASPGGFGQSNTIGTLQINSFGGR